MGSAVEPRFVSNGSALRSSLRVCSTRLCGARPTARFCRWYGAHADPARSRRATAASLSSTLPTLGTGTLNAVPLLQLAFNQRGTGLWAACTPDEGIGISGSNGAVNGIMVLNSQSTGTSVPVNYKMIFSE
jgi:hypothetical protein